MDLGYQKMKEAGRTGQVLAAFINKICRPCFQTQRFQMCITQKLLWIMM